MGLQILGTDYSERLRSLYEQVQSDFARPIRIVPTTGHVDNSVEIRPAEILLRLRPGSSEDNIAHELMHPILEFEGFPKIFSIPQLPLSTSLAGLIRADLDHLIINARLQRLGYDPFQGFLKTAAGPGGFLGLERPTDANQLAVFLVATLHELIKFSIYMRDQSAEEAILKKNPDASTYWVDLKSSIDTLAPEPTPWSMWNVVNRLNVLADRVCTNLSATIRFSNLVGFDPVPLSQETHVAKASSVLTESVESLPSEGILLRTFLTAHHVLVGAQVLRYPSSSLGDISTGEFLAARGIPILPVPDGEQAALN